MPRYTDQQIIDALRATKGMVWVAADRLGCDGHTISKRLAKSPAIQAAVAAERGKMGDTAELKLAQAIQHGEPWAIQFYLKTQHKERGYVERLEQTGANGGPIEVQGDLDVRIAARLEALADRGQAAPIVETRSQIRAINAAG